MVKRIVQFMLVAALSLLPAGIVIGQETSAQEAPSKLLPIIFAGGWIGVLIIGILLALSMTAAYLIIDHLLTVRRKDLMPDGMGEQIGQLLQGGRVSEAKQLCADNPSVLSFIMLHGISELEFGWSAVEKALEDALAEQSARLFRKIEYLAVIGNIAPMVGLLGTRHRHDHGFSTSGSQSRRGERTPVGRGNLSSAGDNGRRIDRRHPVLGGIRDFQKPS